MKKSMFRDGIGPSRAARIVRRRAALLYVVGLGVLAAIGFFPKQSAGQGKAVESLNWKAKVTYKETATSPKAHRVKTLETRFEFRSGLIGPQDYTEDNEWTNVTIAYADSGRWHLDPEDMDEWTGPTTDGWWNVKDTLTIPSAKSSHVYDDLPTRRPHGDVQELQLPTLPVSKAGSIVLVQPQGVGFFLHVMYNKTQSIKSPETGQDVTDLDVRILGEQPAPAPGENIEAGDDSSGEYEGLTPEVAQMLKMADAMTEGAEGESEDDQVALMGLKMNGYVEFDGEPVVGTRTWTSTADNPGPYTSSIPDSLTTVTHELSWEFVPVKAK